MNHEHKFKTLNNYFVSKNITIPITSNSLPQSGFTAITTVFVYLLPWSTKSRAYEPDIDFVINETLTVRQSTLSMFAEQV